MPGLTTAHRLPPHHRRSELRESWGIGFGYAGTGCHTLARLVDVLLDGISAPAVSAGVPDAPRTLSELLRDTAATTTYTRAQLLTAQAG
ncbi:hypothetical protein [Streptomyces lushanensis]|uniref:hypothetical protein n=1 Tax=Streptomyces lushanensis TaxID=1434255 RepID=UPI0008323B43|nr:hypothetical protein [Streptomyces lushanensis]